MTRIAVSLLCLMLVAGSYSAHTAAGSLDPTFGSGGKVETGEHREPSKMACRLLWRHCDDRRFQASTNDFGDVPDRYSLLRDRVIPCARFPLLQS